MAFVPCILMVIQIISQLLLRYVLWAPIRSDFNAIRIPPLELSKALSLWMYKVLALLLTELSRCVSVLMIMSGL